jgi:hypothetical protein
MRVCILNNELPISMTNIVTAYINFNIYISTNYICLGYKLHIRIIGEYFLKIIFEEIFYFIDIHACNYFTIPFFRVDVKGGPFIRFHVCPEMK